MSTQIAVAIPFSDYAPIVELAEFGGSRGMVLEEAGSVVAMAGHHQAKLRHPLG